MALTVSGLKIAAVGLSQRACRPTLFQAAKYSWEPKEVETHTGQVSAIVVRPTVTNDRRRWLLVVLILLYIVL